MRALKFFQRLICSLLFLAGLAGVIAVLTHVTRNKNEAEIVYPYYHEAEDSLDVVFVGSSHIMCGVYPMDLYHDFGIVSYDYASSALVLPQSYYQTIEALKTQSPKVLVLDASGAVYDGKVGSKEYVHTQLDNMKWSLNKVRAIQDLIEDPADRAEYYFPLIRFHTRWKELEDRDFRSVTGRTKGAYLSEAVIQDPELEPVVPEDYAVPLAENAEAYLRKILDFCRDSGIEVLLLNTPYLIQAEEQGKCNEAGRIAAEYGVPCLNLMYHLEEMDFDWLTDMRDHAHCNISGAQKVTAFVGAYLKEHYDLPDRRGDGTWDAAYEAYKGAYPY